MYEELSQIDALNQNRRLSLLEFSKVVGGAITLLHRAFEGKLRVPDFQAFCAIFEEVYKIVE